jgi:hypothetical protein
MRTLAISASLPDEVHEFVSRGGQAAADQMAASALTMLHGMARCLALAHLCPGDDDGEAAAKQKLVAEVRDLVADQLRWSADVGYVDAGQSDLAVSAKGGVYGKDVPVLTLDVIVASGSPVPAEAFARSAQRATRWPTRHGYRHAAHVVLSIGGGGFEGRDRVGTCGGAGDGPMMIAWASFGSVDHALDRANLGHLIGSLLTTGRAMMQCAAATTPAQA